MWIKKDEVRINLNNVVYYESVDSNVRELDETKPAYWIAFYYYSDYKIVKFETREERDIFLKDIDANIGIGETL
jgi:hypothetical protein